MHTQDKLSETLLLAKNQEAQILELSRAAHDATQSSRESALLKDKLQEFQSLADKYQKIEGFPCIELTSAALNEKYKKKLDDAADLRKRVKSLQQENSSLRSEHAEYEAELGKLKDYKPLLDSFRDQLKESEEKNAALLMQGSKIEFDMREYRLKMDRLEQEKKAALELNHSLEDRLQELEQQGEDHLVISGGATLAGEMADGATTSSAPQQLYIACSNSQTS